MNYGKILSLSALMLITTATGIYAADGDTFSYRGLNYAVISEADRTCEVAPNDSATVAALDGAIIIPPLVTRCDTIEYSVVALGTNAFYSNLAVRSISIPETVTMMRTGSLSRCYYLEEVVLPNSITEMETRAMYANIHLKRLTISSGLREIRRETFSGCSDLAEIVIPDGVEIIGPEAFNYCGVLSLSLGSTVKTIGKMAFGGSEKLCHPLVIPASVTTLGEEAFTYCPKLRTVIFEEGPTTLSIDKNVFGDVSYLSGITSIACALLDTVTINRNIKFINTTNNKQYPFTYLPTITTVNFGGSLTSIPGSLFVGCTGIKEVNSSLSTPPQLFASCFDAAIYTGAPLTVPADAVDTYKAANNWKKFTNIVAFADPQEPEPEHPVQPWTLSADSLDLEVGQNAVLSLVTVEDGYSPEHTVAAGSSEPAVATVTAIPGGDLLVRAVAPGTALVTVTVTPEGGEPYILECKVNVPAPVSAIHSISTDPDAAAVTLYDLSGRPVTTATPAPGIYLRRTPSGTTKVIIK